MAIKYNKEFYDFSFRDKQFAIAILYALFSSHFFNNDDDYNLTYIPATLILLKTLSNLFFLKKGKNKIKDNFHHKMEKLNAMN